MMMGVGPRREVEGPTLGRHQQVGESRELPQGQAMLTYEVQPHRGVGPVMLGMERMRVHEVMPESPCSFKKTPVSEYETDAFHQSGFQVFYGGDSPRVEYIELSRDCGFSVFYRKIDVFGTPASELVDLLSRDAAIDQSNPEHGYSYSFPELDLCVWRSVIPDSASDEEGRRFDTIGIGVEGYFTGHPGS